MKRSLIIVLMLCTIGMAYGYWGAFTMSGQKYYDEMAAMTPFFVLVGCSIVFIVALGIMMISLIKKK